MAFRWLDVVGARPQFIKLGPILRAIQAHDPGTSHPRIEEILIHTGQHYDHRMSRLLFEELELKRPDVNLGVGSDSHGRQTAAMLEKMEATLESERPAVVVVYGDTNSTLAAALAAAKMHIPVAHVEAGLRNYNRQMPEEVNRILTDHVSTLLLCPTSRAVDNLRREGIVDGVHLVGDVMLDSVLHNLEIARRRSRIRESLDLEPGSYALATIHRAENTDHVERLTRILAGLDRLARRMPVILPAHPRTRKAIDAFDIAVDHVRIVEPAGYLDMLRLEEGARVVITDSGGVQKEAFFLEVPCVTVRDETEWVETVEAGWNVLVPADPSQIERAAAEASPGREQTPFGDGGAAEKTVSAILDAVSIETG